MHQRKIAVIGLGYVGLPIALAFSDKAEIVAFDIDQLRVDELKKGFDRTDQVDRKRLQNKNIKFTSNPNVIKDSDFFIIAVPTPIDNAKQPDLTFLLGAVKAVGSRIKKGAIVVIESTVFPGTTEELCVPELEKYSGLVCGKDFFVAYSPERINPGDPEHQFETIRKIVSAQNAETLEIVASVYESVVTAGVLRVDSIKIAEAAKVIENIQRDLNIALINELAKIFDLLEIDTKKVLDAAGTKWNFLPFEPGMVGGHCIGVDPYYLTYKAIQLGYHSEIILAGRRINDSMGKYIAEKTIKNLIRFDKKRVRDAKISILGFTFKENCPDIRNTKVIDIYSELKGYGCNVMVHDPLADPDHLRRKYGIELCDWEEMRNSSAIVLAVPHDEYKTKTTKFYKQYLIGAKLIVDVKSIISIEDAAREGIQLWRL